MAAADVATEPSVSLTLEPDAPNPRVRMVLRGSVRGDDVADAFIRLYDEHPETAYYDRLFDLTAYTSGFGLGHLQRMAPAYARANTDPSHPCRTALVTRDQHMRLWSESMGYQFKGREHRAFASFDEAERFLAEPLAARRAFPLA